jgi:hypothetical protein
MSSLEYFISTSSNISVIISKETLNDGHPVHSSAIGKIKVTSKPFGFNNDDISVLKMDTMHKGKYNYKKNQLFHLHLNQKLISLYSQYLYVYFKKLNNYLLDHL